MVQTVPGAAGRRSSRPVRRAVEQYRDETLARFEAGEEITCWLCSQPIDMTLPDKFDPGHFEVDHVHPVSVRPDLADDVANMRPSHRECNSERSNRDDVVNLGWTSEDWEALAG